ncbi:MAG: DNA topoisomerase IV subunit A [Treponema sp.]|uniref:DNA topoisomerase IV subunit A n=1 Tax=Treponema sp. TaxID=166 RepID=UPI002A91C8A0|nr:DNA topoisomerase IV subunit A [Treponema sp.]MDY6396457.1 DNA topoisomerase IV subunit A [Treponema sp.]
MAFVKNLFDKNFIEYASYVIRDRAIPDLEDGLKPVQRRIMHTLFEVNDGLFQKVQFIVGRTMKYHPHGDASIYGALVNLANKEIFIEKQGNFGNKYTGDGASAGRYIECRVHPLAKEFLVTNKEITHYVPNYDGRDLEPEVYRSKLPVTLLIGAEGIAVGMSTKILPYNLKEVLEAEIKCLKGEKFSILPDVSTGGLIDVSNYKDGNGKIITRAKFDTSDEKKIIITELPLDTNAKGLLESIDSAYKAGKIKISSVDNFTTDHCNIEIKLPRGVYSKDVIDALYAYTDCEKTIACSMLVIKDNMPVVMTATEIIKYYAQKLTAIIKDELEFEKRKLTDELHLRTLERIFVEERIYKEIETKRTAETVAKAVKDGFKPFKDELVRDVSDEDVEHLLQIPIRRISLFDIQKNRDQVKAIKDRLKEINRRLKDLTGCAVEYLNGMLDKFKKISPELLKRNTTIAKFSATDVKEVARQDLSLRYDDKGYLGLNVSGGSELMKVSPYDRIICVRKNGMYAITDVPDKLFIDKGMWFCALADKEKLPKVLFTVIFKDPQTGYASIKRCRIPSWIMNRDYFLAPDGMEVLHIDTREKFTFTLNYVKKPRVKITEEKFKAQDFEEKGLKTLGVRLSAHEVESIKVDGVQLELGL